MSEEGLIVSAKAGEPETTEIEPRQPGQLDRCRNLRFTVIGVIPALISLFLAIIENGDTVIYERPGHGVFDDLSMFVTKKKHLGTWE